MNEQELKDAILAAFRNEACPGWHSEKSLWEFSVLPKEVQQHTCVAEVRQTLVALARERALVQERTEDFRWVWRMPDPEEEGGVRGLTPEEAETEAELARLRKENAALRDAGIVEAEVVRLRGQIRAIVEALKLEGNQLWQGAEYHDVGEFILEELLPRLEAVLREEKP